MAMAKRLRRPEQPSMWVATQDLPRTAAHPFYTRLNQILDEANFDGYVGSLCQRFLGRRDCPSWFGARTLLPIAADRLLRRLLWEVRSPKTSRDGDFRRVVFLEVDATDYDHNATLNALRRDVATTLMHSNLLRIMLAKDMAATNRACE